MAHCDGTYKIYNAPVQCYRGRAWRLVKNYRRRTTYVAGENDKRCATKHAEISSVKYVEYCKDVYDYNVNSKSTAFPFFF